MGTTQTNRLVPQSVWSGLSETTIALVFAITLLVSTGSLIALSYGDPELLALFAISGLAVVLLGLTAVRLTESLRTSGIPVVERPVLGN